MSFLVKGMYRVIIVFGLALVFLAALYATMLKTPNFCRMTYMNPYYAEMPVDSQYSYKYNLLLYKEGNQRMSAFLQDPWPKGIPVLFIPGNAGHYKQGRSLASASTLLNDETKAKLALPLGPEFDFFTIDSLEELSALNGELLLEQSKFVNDAISAILDVYQYLPDKKTDLLPARPTSVLLVGHSMGGLIAASVFTQENFIPGSVTTIITLNTPHNGHPLFYRKSLADYYHETHRYWKKNIYTSLRDVALISISGSFRDQLIDSSLTSLHELVPTSNAFSVLTTSVPSVWVETDHQCIVWCNQLIVKISFLLLDLVDPSSFQNTFPLADRMKIFQKHLLSNIPKALGLSRESDKRFLPVHFVASSIDSYNTAIDINPSNDLSKSIIANETIFYDVPEENKMPLTYFGLPQSAERSDSTMYLRVPQNVLQNEIHFVYLSGSLFDSFDIYLCEEALCTSSLTDQSISIPSHSSLRQYSGEHHDHRNHFTDDNDKSIQTIFHLSPYQISSYKYIIIAQRSQNGKMQQNSLAQFYRGKHSNSEIKNSARQYRLDLKTTNHAALLNVSLPLHDKLDSYVASVEPQCSNPAFPAVIIQYRAALHEQHIHTNATVVPLRFHISTPDDHHLIVITDPQCEYKLRITKDIPLTLAGLFYFHRAAAVSGIAAWFCFVFALQQFTFARTYKFPSFKESSVLGLFSCCGLLGISLLIPNNFFSFLFSSLPEPLNEHSFFYFEEISPMALRIVLFSSCCCAITLFALHYILLQLFAIIVHILRKITQTDNYLTVNPTKGLLLTTIAIILGYYTHIIVPLVFALVQLGISQSKILFSSENGEWYKDGIQNSQASITFLLAITLIECIPSVIQFVKAFLYEIRIDDGFLISHYSLIVLSYFASHFRPHPRHMNWIFSFFVFVAILGYALVPFYKISWFIGGLSIICIISYFPMQVIGATTATEQKPKNNKSKTD